MVKCADCGFLTLRDKATGELVEVIDDYRVSGRVPDWAIFRHYHNYPICFVMAYDLMPEVERQALKQIQDNISEWGKYVLELIQKERLCPPDGNNCGFTNYQQGFTPKEHQEMLDEQWKREYEAKREDTDREWRAEQRRLDLGWREEQDEKAERRHRWDLIITGIVATALICGATIAAAFISRNN